MTRQTPSELDSAYDELYNYTLGTSVLLLLGKCLLINRVCVNNRNDDHPDQGCLYLSLSKLMTIVLFSFFLFFFSFFFFYLYMVFSLCTTINFQSLYECT